MKAKMIKGLVFSDLISNKSKCFYDLTFFKILVCMNLIPKFSSCSLCLCVFVVFVCGRPLFSFLSPPSQTLTHENGLISGFQLGPESRETAHILLLEEIL